MDYAKQMYEKSSQPKNDCKGNDHDNISFNHTKKTHSNNAFFRNNGRVNNIFSVNTNSSSDSDMSLILALILLLSKDSGDSILILALLYILS